MNLRDPGSLPSWSLNRQIERWIQQSKQVVLAVEQKVISEWTGTQQLLVRDWLSKTSANLATGSAPIMEEGMIAFAHVRNIDSENLQWSSRDSLVLEPSEHWPMELNDKILFGSSPSIKWQEYDQSKLKGRAGTTKLILGQKYTGAVNGFGIKLADTIKEALAKIDIDHSDIIGASYTDRYLVSPLTIRLLIDCVSKTISPGSLLEIYTVDPMNLNSRNSRGAVHENFTTRQDMQTFAAGYGTATGLVVKLRTKRVPHYRRLTLQLTDDRVVNIDFDQGMGWLSYHHPRDWKITRSQNPIDAVKVLSGRLELIGNSESQAFLYLDN